MLSGFDELDIDEEPCGSESNISPRGVDGLNFLVHQSQSLILGDKCVSESPTGGFAARRAHALHVGVDHWGKFRPIVVGHVCRRRCHEDMLKQRVLQSQRDQTTERIAVGQIQRHQVLAKTGSD